MYELSCLESECVEQAQSVQCTSVYFLLHVGINLRCFMRLLPTCRMIIF